MRAVHAVGAAVASAAAVCLLATAAVAQPAAPAAYDPKAAFAESDTNRDGKVDHQEFVARMTEVFFAADRDKNGTLTEVEAAATLTTTPGDESDANEDGAVTLGEFTRARLVDYDAADANRNGVLELEEVLIVAEPERDR